MIDMDIGGLVTDRGEETIAGRVCASSATFSTCRTYRYLLARWWDGRRPLVVFVMLNPSTADALKLDPTIRRCFGFASAWGFGGLAVVNLFALRATNPVELGRCAAPVGEIDQHGAEVNDRVIGTTAGVARLIICAWGAHPMVEQRGARVLALLGEQQQRLACLGWSREGHPRHPLYLRGDSRPLHFLSPLDDEGHLVGRAVDLAPLLATTEA